MKSLLALPFVMIAFGAIVVLVLLMSALAEAKRPLGHFGGSHYDSGSLANPYGAGSPYGRAMNPYGRYGSRYKLRVFIIVKTAGNPPPGD